MQYHQYPPRIAYRRRLVPRRTWREWLESNIPIAKEAGEKAIEYLEKAKQAHDFIQNIHGKLSGPSSEITSVKPQKKDFLQILDGKGIAVEPVGHFHKCCDHLDGCGIPAPQEDGLEELHDHVERLEHHVDKKMHGLLMH